MKLSERLEEHADMHANVSPHDDEQAQWEADLREAAAIVRAWEGAPAGHVVALDFERERPTWHVMDDREAVPLTFGGEDVRLVPAPPTEKRE